MAIQSLPEPAIEILELLAKDDKLAAQGIINHFSPKYEIKAIKYALRRLLENKLIHRVPNLLDMRSVYYRVATQAELSDIQSTLAESISKDIFKAIA